MQQDMCEGQPCLNSFGLSCEVKQSVYFAFRLSNDWASFNRAPSA